MFCELLLFNDNCVKARGQIEYNIGIKESFLSECNELGNLGERSATSELFNSCSTTRRVKRGERNGARILVENPQSCETARNWVGNSKKGF